MLEPLFFPVPDSSYCTNGMRMDKVFPLSLLAWSTELLTAEGNLMAKADVNRGHIFLRSESIPLPRPATQLAWERVCRLGKPDSRSFLLPFLPAISAEDEMGQAISEKGIHIPSLSRRSSLHVRETVQLQDGKRFDGIVWGPVWRGLVTANAIKEGVIDGGFTRSNLVEAVVTHQRNIWPETAQDSIRQRMEFLAQYGVPAYNLFAKEKGLGRINRVLLQPLIKKHADEWAFAYARNYVRIREDVGLIEADYKEFMHEYAESQKEKLREEQKNIAPKSGFDLEALQKIIL
jgi:hypothetical protein